MQLCEECGAELPNGAQFCGHCGSQTKTEDDTTRSTDFASIEDKSLEPSEVATILDDSQDLAPEIENEDRLQSTAVPPEQSAEDEKGEQTHHEQNESTSAMPDEVSWEPEILTNPLPADQSFSIQTKKSLDETHSPYASTQKPGSQPTSKCLLFSLVGLIAIIAVAAALVGLIHQHLPVIGGSSNVLPSSSNNEIIDSSGSSLTASVCINASTPSSSATNQGSSFTLTSSTGCSNVVASKADSTCLTFPSGDANAHKYIVDVSDASIGNSYYHLILSVVEYTVPAIYSDAKHLSIGLSEGSTGRNFAWFYRSGSVSVNHDELSGSMDVILAPENHVNTLHVVGVWACGHQIKSS